MLKILFGFFIISLNTKGSLETTDASIKMRVNIIKAYHGLAITDESGIVLNELVLDHGQIIKGMATDDSIAQKIFLVKRFDNGNSVDIGPGTLKATFGNGSTNEVANLYKDGDLTLSNFTSQLKILFGGKNSGRVKSIILKDILNGDIDHGKYHNLGGNTLKVTYTP